MDTDSAPKKFREVLLVTWQILIKVKLQTNECANIKRDFNYSLLNKESHKH